MDLTIDPKDMSTERGRIESSASQSWECITNTNGIEVMVLEIIQFSHRLISPVLELQFQQCELPRCE